MSSNRMDHAVERFFMNDETLRSAPQSRLDYELGRRGSSYVTSGGLDRIGRRDYFEDSLFDDSDDLLNYPSSSLERSIYAPDGASGRSMEEIIRRTNTQVQLANASIVDYSEHAQIHPKMMRNGRFPTIFRLPVQLRQLLQIDGRQLNSIIQQYELQTEYRGRSRGSIWDDDEGFGSASRPGQLRKITALLEFLGATRLAQQLRRRLSTSSMGSRLSVPRRFGDMGGGYIEDDD